MVRILRVTNRPTHRRGVFKAQVSDVSGVGGEQFECPFVYWLDRRQKFLPGERIFKWLCGMDELPHQLRVSVYLADLASVFIQEPRFSYIQSEA